MQDPRSKLNFSVAKGATFAKSLQYTGPKPDYTPIDLTGATVTGKVYLEGDDVDMTCTITNDEEGRISLSIPAATTATMEADVYRYEVLLTFADGTIKPLLYGNFNVFSIE